MAVSLFSPCSLTDDRWSLSHALGSCVPSNFGVSEGSLKFRGIRVRRTDLLKHRAPQSSPSSSSISDSDEHARISGVVVAVAASRTLLPSGKVMFLLFG